MIDVIAIENLDCSYDGWAPRTALTSSQADRTPVRYATASSTYLQMANEAD